MSVERTPEVVAPSGVYGFRRIKNIGGPVVQVVESTSGRWLGTPASYYAADVARWPAGQVVAVDGSHWRLSAEDSAAFRAYAQSVAGS